LQEGGRAIVVESSGEENENIRLRLARADGKTHSVDVAEEGTNLIDFFGLEGWTSQL
jgi:hypothetical protein